MNETRGCQNCKQSFVIEPEDFEFYKKINVPPPTFCPDCRLQRRLAFRNERGLHVRKCDLCKKQIIAMYPEGVPFPVYCPTCWYSDAYDPLAFGRPYDFAKNFFAQFKELQNVVPRIALEISQCENSDFSNQVANCKNCYLIFSASNNENCLYGQRIIGCEHTVDCTLMLQSRHAYGCVECLNVSNTHFSADCADDYDLLFCYDARGSRDCFMSSNIRRGAYIFRNKKLSENEYREKMKEIDTGSYKNILAYKAEYAKFMESALRSYAKMKNVVDATGDVLTNANACHACFGGANIDRCRYCLYINDAKDGMDINNGFQMELAYEACTVGVSAYDIKFCVDAWPSASSLEYSSACRDGSSNLFGCIGLRGKKHCILNQQYEEKEYKTLLEKIKQQMKEVPYRDRLGIEYRYGEFFPSEISPFAYNETVAQEYFSLSQKEIESKGYSYLDGGASSGPMSIAAADLPDHARDVKDDIVRQAIRCAHEGSCNEKCTRFFKITAQELAFYREKNIALPRICPNCRHFERMRLRNPVKLFARVCACAGTTSREGRVNLSMHSHGTAACGKELVSVYSLERKEVVYCEECYQSEVV